MYVSRVKMTIEDCADRVLDLAILVGGLEEVARISREGWRGNAVVATLPARAYEDHDDYLRAAVVDVATAIGLETRELSAEWEDERERKIIVVRCRAKSLMDAIQARAKRIVETGTGEV